MLISKLFQYTSPQKFTPNPNPSNPPTSQYYVPELWASIPSTRHAGESSVVFPSTHHGLAYLYHFLPGRALQIDIEATASRYRAFHAPIHAPLSFSSPLSLSTIRRRTITSRWPRKDRRPDPSTRIGHGFSVIFLCPFVVGRARPAEVRETRIQFDSRTPALVARGASRDHSSLEMGSSAALQANSNFWSLDSEHFQRYWQVFWVFSEMIYAIFKYILYYYFFSFYQNRLAKTRSDSVAISKIRWIRFVFNIVARSLQG